MESQYSRKTIDEVGAEEDWSARLMSSKLFIRSNTALGRLAHWWLYCGRKEA